MTSQQDVARMFARGDHPDDIPPASNFGAIEVTGHDEFEAALTSYGWAVVFGRRHDGSVVEFTGWRGYSTATSTQMGKARNAMRRVLGDVPEADDRQPKNGGNSLNWRVNQSGAEPL